jgi:pimeloyl-ACP methyl ester carboxylesterase
MPSMDPALLEHHAHGAELDWSNREHVMEYQVDAWRLLNGSAHPFDEDSIRRLAAQDFDRTPDLRTSFHHAGLDDAGGWTGRLSEIRAPALIIHGTEDNVLPYAHGLALHRELPDSTLVTLEGTGHELHPADWPVMLEAIEKHTAALPTLEPRL